MSRREQKPIQASLSFGPMKTPLHQETQTKRTNFDAITGSPSNALQALDAGATVENKSGAVECTSAISAGGFNQYQPKPYGAGLLDQRLMARNNRNPASSRRT